VLADKNQLKFMATTKKIPTVRNSNQIGASIRQKTIAVPLHRLAIFLLYHSWMRKHKNGIFFAELSDPAKWTLKIKAQPSHGRALCEASLHREEGRHVMDHTYIRHPTL
jgi:hypothetical protein